MDFNIPNILTLLRFFLIPCFLISFYLPFIYSPVITVLIFSIAAITDWLDGFLARRWNQTSNFGGFLDPIADKVMVSTALILICEYFHVYWITIPTIIIISREIIISALRQWIYNTYNTVIPVLWIGKLKTTIQMFSLFLLIWHPNILLIKIGIVILYIALILTLWAMFLYIRICQHYLLKKNNYFNY
ncbi:CDP-diacylglycerol--glycerol-3-phosphate 3-phosphatidyltransferase [Candidatus Pantoea edessiphila]|uniref:CDP-diacylglycerol--glycerol-3-phosphate 3-phosphatidyltransferase n=1 Tax=Candidatus Pantoea edessiphila TaxID=2044610 RepID=A0A2P5SYW3_9GAMM|nr:CDP-diacylglycerol--glycerol-3-phosphate 3-phosphatidyltransferase [Candidatus Pantoea edessiphila]MBK4775342.1 CDP-diacylglycerol--glycerol-3-phosphate 3-phosphatidyltransferase [Pantoea sp. Edef]PPI87524.1 CDP-diacylglycerol--glycerol-3-phosphate 3-phosphatidyltransferase [Candidatus Pantoea edessiphila]